MHGLLITEAILYYAMTLMFVAPELATSIGVGDAAIGGLVACAAFWIAMRLPAKATKRFRKLFFVPMGIGAVAVVATVATGHPPDFWALALLWVTAAICGAGTGIRSKTLVRWRWRIVTAGAAGMALVGFGTAVALRNVLLGCVAAMVIVTSWVAESRASSDAGRRGLGSGPSEDARSDG